MDTNLRPDLKLDWCSHQAAKYAVEHWHYSKKLPHQKLVKIGVWENSKFIGVVLFGDGANAGMFAPYGLTYEQGCELVRVALTEHATAVTRIIRVAMRFLKKACPGIKLVISFADPEQGHVGAIYQAGNWIYAGMTTAADEYVVNGVRMHGRALRSTRSTHKLGGVKASNVMEWAGKVLDPNIRKIPGSSKHRYLMPLDPELQSKLDRIRLPYPKRVPSDTSDTATSPVEEGGVIPTGTLQKKKQHVKAA